MTDRESLDPRMTPNALVAECSRMTRLQHADYLRPLMGKWLKVRGFVLASTDNRPLAGFGVTIIVPDPASAIDVYCAFDGDYERLALVAPDDVVEVEGALLDISGRNIKLDSCILLDTIDRSRVSEVVTRDQHLRAFLGSFPELGQEAAPARPLLRDCSLRMWHPLSTRVKRRSR